MKDTGTTPVSDSPDRDVVRHLARRLRADTDLAYLIGPGTELYERLVRAEMAATGQPRDVVLASLQCEDMRDPEVLALRERSYADGEYCPRCDCDDCAEVARRLPHTYCDLCGCDACVTERGGAR